MSFCLASSLPRLPVLIQFDALIAHMQAVAWADKEGYKMQRKESDTDSTTSESRERETSSVTNDPEVYSSSESIDDQQSKLTEDSILTPGELLERTQLSNELLLKLLDSYRLISNIVKQKMLKQLSSSTPEQALNLIVPVVSDKPAIMLELHAAFLKLLPNEDKQLIANEWPKCLLVNDDAFNGKQHPVEPYTLSVIDAHISELTKTNTYSTLHTLKHCLKSILHLIELLLPFCTSIAEMEVQSLLIATMMDMRTDYLQSQSEQCLREILHGLTNEAHKQLLFEHMIGHCYQMLIEFSAELRQSSTGGTGAVANADQEQRALFNESMLFAVLKTMIKMLDVPTAVQAMRQFFKEERAGSLTTLLLSFTGTSLPLSYARKMLQFAERLFEQAAQSDSQFQHEDLVECFAELGTVDVARLKLWLAHIIYGPNVVGAAANNSSCEASCKLLTSGVMQPSSSSSSNAQTPTNMATVSAMPSISDQLDAMEIDYDCCAGAGGTSGNAAPSTSQILSLWQTVIQPNNQSEDSSQACDQQTGATQHRNGALLLSFVKSLVRDQPAAAQLAPPLFQALLQLGQTLITPPQDGCDFADVLQIMITLADAAPARGHIALFNTTLLWLELAKLQLPDKQLKHAENVSALLRYLSELLQGIGYRGSRQHMPPWDDELQSDIDDLYDELGDDQQEQDSLLDDSDEDTLNNKLCTFSQTQKEFMNQHWYHCHTCNMINTVGVCSVCARVCHKGHEVSYAKYGNFFCDCGAKEDGSCQALSRRLPTSGDSRDGYVPAHMSLLTAGKKRQSPPTQIRKDSLNNERIALLGKLLDPHREALQHPDQWMLVVRCILEYFDVLLPSIRENCTLYSIVGCHKRATAALERLHQLEQNFQVS